MIDAMTTMTMAGVLAPVFGPPIGGLILSITSWRWIFWVNVPIAIIGSYMVWRFVPDVTEGKRRPLDIMGAILSAVTFGGFIFGLQNITSGILPLSVCIMLAFTGAVCGYFLVRHVRRVEHPILDLSLLRMPSFFAATVGGFFPRLTMSATPFLLALLLQIGIGLSPLHAGMIICATGLAQTSMKSATGFFLRRYGFRTVLIASSLLMGVTLGALALVSKGTPIWLVAAMCFVAGGFRTIHFSVLAMLSFCDLNDEQMSRGTSLASVAQQVTQSIGVTFAAFAVHAFMAFSHTDHFALGVIAPAFAVMAMLSTMGVFIFWRMSPAAGAEISGAPIRPRR
jgi:MFS family permease